MNQKGEMFGLYLFIKAIDIVNRSTSTGRWGGSGVELIKSLAHQQYSGAPRPSQELMRAQEDRIVTVDLAQSHVDICIRPTAHTDQ